MIMNLYTEIQLGILTNNEYSYKMHQHHIRIMYAQV